MRTGRLLTSVAAASLVCVALPSAAAAQPAAAGVRGLQRVDHLVVIYEENHSFDNLFGRWPGVNGLAGNPARTPLTPSHRP